jgi:hypothetical protein
MAYDPGMTQPKRSWAIRAAVDKSLYYIFMTAFVGPGHVSKKNFPFNKFRPPIYDSHPAHPGHTRMLCPTEESRVPGSVRISLGRRFPSDLYLIKVALWGVPIEIDG